MNRPARTHPIRPGTVAQRHRPCQPDHRAEEDIDLSEWVAGNPADVLATNFGKPASLFQKFPSRDAFISDKNGER